MQQYNHRQGQPVSGLSMAAMICGIVSFPAFCCGILGMPVPIAAVICGHLGIKDLKDNPEKTGKDLRLPLDQIWAPPVTSGLCFLKKHLKPNFDSSRLAAGPNDLVISKAATFKSRPFQFLNFRTLKPGDSRPLLISAKSATHPSPIFQLHWNKVSTLPLEIFKAGGLLRIPPHIE